MTKDRMPDLQMANRHAGGSVKSSSRKYSELNDFLEEIAVIRDKIESIEEKTKETRELHDQLFASASPPADLQKNIDEHTMKIQDEILEIRRNIKALEESHDNEPKSRTQARIKAAQLAAIQTFFINATEKHANVLLDFRERCSTRLRQQLKIVNRKSTDPETMDLLESGEMASLFVDNYMLDYRSARLALAEAEERCNQLHQVEKQLYELRDLFVDLAILIEHQGTLIDQIHFYSENTELQIGRARDSMWKTLKKQAQLRKKKIIILVIIIMVILIILLCLILG